jgi:hypothetical protein
MNTNNQYSASVSQPQPAPRSPPEYVVYHDFTGPARLTTTLVHVISDVTGVDVTDTEFTLNDYVDPDALNRLFAPKADGTPRTRGDVRVTILDCQVTIFADGRIVIVLPAQTRQVPR